MIAADALRVELWGLLGVLGLLVGSFLNVCIYRLPFRRSVIRPRSSCPQCGAPIRWYDNVPIFSWLRLRGRCADCGTPISIRYPLVELANAAVWLLLAARFGLSVQTLVLLPLGSALIVLFFTDLDHKLLPDAVTLPLAVYGLAVAAWNARLDIGLGLIGSGSATGRVLGALAGAALGYGIFFVLAMAWRVLFAREALGGGDLKLMLGVGALLGMHGAVLTIFAASLAGTLVHLPQLVLDVRHLRHELPFGCYLAPAALLTAFFGLDVARWYMSLLWLPGAS